jgi:periplasmic divalent cation tolerance protein
MTKYILVISTVSSKKEAQKLARVLLDKKLAACINIISGVDSIYTWKGKVEKASEYLLLIKTKTSLFNKIKKVIKENHSYEMPEILSVEINKGSKEYLKWLDSCL